MKRAIEEGLIRREDIFITSKLWNTYHSREHAIAMGKKSNDAWGLGYLDLYLIHYPIALKYVDPSDRQYPVSDSIVVAGNCAKGGRDGFQTERS